MNGQNRCRELMGDGSLCPFEKWSSSSIRDTSCCVFHSEMVVEKRHDFINAFKKYIKEIKSEPKIDAFDFSSFVFPDYSFQHEQFEKPVNFFQAKFLGNADFYRAVFHQGGNFNLCQFKEGGSFRRARFLKGMDFSFATFGKISRFEEAEFIGNSSFVTSTFLDSVVFHGAKFQGTTMFSDATFSKDAIFMEVRFEGNVFFERSTFNGMTLFFNSRFSIDSINANSQKVNFVGATFEKKTSFQEAEFEIEVDFTGATFKNEAYFYSTAFKEIVDFMGVTFDGKVLFAGGRKTKVFYGECYFPRIHLGKDAVVTFEDSDLSNAVFLDTNIELFVFRNVTWHQTKNRRRALRNEFPPTGDGPDPKDYESIAENYRQLVLNYERKRDYEAAEDFHVGEMEIRRKKVGAGAQVPSWVVWAISQYQGFLNLFNWTWLQDIFARVKSKIIWLRKWVNSYQLYKILSNYGTSYWRALGVLIFFLLAFSWFFLYSGFQASETRIGGRDELKTDAIEYNIFQDTEHSCVSFGQWLSDYFQAIQLTMSIITFQRERFYEPIGTLGRFLLFAAVIVLASQVALVFLAIRRRFKR